MQDIEPFQHHSPKKKKFNWLYNQPKVAKVGFLSALIIGFVSHIFIYTGRYFGCHDVGLYWSTAPAVSSGRWLNRIINHLTYGYVMPLIIGLFVTLFLSLSTFYICKIFNIEKKSNAILIGSLLTTFPSIAFTNLYLYDSANYHFGVILAVLAVYVTIRYKFGFILGAIFLMFTLAIYQSKFNIALVVCVYYLIHYVLSTNFSFKRMKVLVLRFSLLIVLASLFYAISLPISFHIYNTDFGGNRGFSPDSIRERILTISGFINELTRTYREFFRSFAGDIYLVVNSLLYAYLILTVLAVVLVIYMIVEKKIYKQPMRLLLILLLVCIIPFASNFAGFLATDTYGVMIYSFVLLLVFYIILFEFVESMSTG